MSGPVYGGGVNGVAAGSADFAERCGRRSAAPVLTVLPPPPSLSLS